ncbi:MAG: type II toxin-antitoxin system VapC family toxin [Acidimicrobiales bacterium]
MPDLLVDTDIFVDHLRGASRLRTGRNTISYSVVTRCELFAGSRSDEVVVRNLLAPFEEIPLGREIAERAGRIRRETGIRTPDALIAATALEHGLSLATRNLRDYKEVRGLRLAPPRARPQMKSGPHR